MKPIIVFAFLASFVEKIVGHPYAQLLPFQAVDERAYGQYNYPNQVVYPPKPETQRASIPGQYPCSYCPNQRASFTPNENAAPAYSLPGYSYSYTTPQRFIRSNVEVARTPSIEKVEIPAPMAADPSENRELSYMRTVRSAVEALGLGQITIPLDRETSTRLEVPVDATHRDHATKRLQSQDSESVNSSPESFGLYYNVRVQSYNSVPSQLPVHPTTETSSEARENKLDEQQKKVLAGIDELLLLEMMALSQQEYMRLLAERVFEDQESYSKEIKRLLNIIRKTGDSKEKVGNVSAQLELGSDSMTEAPELMTATSTSKAPDTASTVPTITTATTPSTTTPQSIVDDA